MLPHLSVIVYTFISYQHMSKQNFQSASSIYSRTTTPERHIKSTFNSSPSFARDEECNDTTCDLSHNVTYYKSLCNIVIKCETYTASPTSSVYGKRNINIMKMNVQSALTLTN